MSAPRLQAEPLSAIIRSTSVTQQENCPHDDAHLPGQLGGFAITVKVERNVLHLPAIALRGLVVFPNNLLHFEVGRDKSIAAVEWAVSNNSDVFLIAQKEMKVEDPNAADLCTYGVVAEIKQVMRVSDDLVRILVEGKYRAKLTQLDTDGSFLLSTVRSAPVKQAKPEEQPEVDVLSSCPSTSRPTCCSVLRTNRPFWTRARCWAA